MPQGRVVDHEGVEGLFDRVAGNGFVLLIDSRVDGAAASTAGDVAGSPGVQVFQLVTTATRPGELADLDQVYGTWFDWNGCAAVLWRPDFYIFGTAPDADAVHALLSDLVDVLTPATVSASA